MIGRVREYLGGAGLGPLLIKATAGSAGLSLIGMFFTFLVGIQLARGLGVEGYGIYGLAISVIALLTVPTEFGLPQLVTREVAAAQVDKDWGRLRGILRWSVGVVILTAAAIAVMVALWLFFAGKGLDAPLPMTILVGLLLVPAVALGNLRAATLRGLQHIVKGQISSTVVRPLVFSLLLFSVPLLTVPLTPVMAIGLGAVAAICALVVAMWLLHQYLPRDVHAAVPKIQGRAWWLSALPMALTEGMRVLQSHLVILLLGVMTTAATVGIFRVASSVALLVILPVTLHHVSGGPVIARLYAQGDLARLQRMLSWMALSMFVSTAVLTLPFVIAGETLLSTVFGNEFSAANAPLLVLCGSALINGFFGASATLLNMTGHAACVTRASGYSLALLAISAMPLITMYGVMGAAAATVMAMLVWNVLMWRDARRFVELDTSLLRFIA